jgi:hypothetical protein
MAPSQEISIEHSHCQFGIVGLMALFAIAFCAGLNPFAAIGMLGVAVGAGLVIGAPPELEFATQWPFLIPVLLLLGIDIVLDKLPATAAAWGKLTLGLRIAGGGLAGGMLGTETVGMVVAIVLGAFVALLATALRELIVRRLGSRFYGLERFVVSASSDAIAVLTTVATVLAAMVGLALAIVVAVTGLYVLVRLAAQPKSG